MASFNDVIAGSSADSSCIQQVVDALKGTAGKGVPISITAVNDSVNWAVDVQNDEAVNSRTFRASRANGTVLIQADVNGVQVSSTGGAPATVVNISDAQTLTNKTLTSPVINGTPTGTAGFGAWSSFTPTLLQNSSAPTFTVNRSAYNVIGKTAFVQVSITINTTGAVGVSSAITLGGIPAAITPAYTNALAAVCGEFTYLRSGIQVYKGAAVNTAPTTIEFYSDSTGGNITGRFGITPLFTVAASDVLGLCATWETT